MFRFRIPKSQLEDLLIMMLFDRLFDESFMIQETEESKFQHIFEAMSSAGFKSKLFSEYFKVDSFIRIRYKRLKKEFTKEGNDVIIQLKDIDQEEDEQ